MRKAWLILLSVMLAVTLAMWGAQASAAETGGYGSAAENPGGAGVATADTGGYGAATEDTGGYGAEKTAAQVVKETKPAKKRRPHKAASTFKKPKPGARVGLMFVISGLLVGIAAGFVLQRGRFCMNTAFRDTIFIKDYTFLRAYFIALMVMIIGGNLLQDFGIIKLTKQPLWYVAQPLGGWIFGMGMVLAGGCGSGILYRVGEGLLAAWVAVVGFFIGIALTSHGLLQPVFQYLRSFSTPVAGKSAAGLYDLFGGGMGAKWGVIAVICVLLSIVVLKGKPFASSKSKGFFWSFTGLLFGLVGVVTFWTSYKYGGFARGLSFTTPTRDVFLTLLTGDAQIPTNSPFNVFSWGRLITTWPAIYVVGVPLGAYISARILKEFTWKTPPAKELLTVMIGSVMMGFGATLGGGCNVGQALTGFATLSIGSIVGSIFIVLGNWTMVYFKFIKPMNDIDLD